MVDVTLKSTSSSGWEYSNVWEDLGLSPMYASFALFLYYYFNNMIVRVNQEYNIWIILVGMKYELAWWLGIDLVIAWLWVQALGNLN